MVSVNLYQAGAFNVTIEFPSTWQELHTSEVMEFCKQQLTNQSLGKAALLIFFLKYRAKLQKVKLPSNWVMQIDSEGFAINGLTLLDFLYTDNELINQPQPIITFQRWFFTRKYYGPDDGFSTITCGEFEDAEIYFNQFIKVPNPIALANLAAILWRTKNQKHTQENARKWALSFSTLQPWQLFAVYLWYVGCRSQLPKMFPTIHESNGKEKSSELDILAFTKCIHAGAGVKNGTRQQIRQMLLLEFFFDMEQEAIKAKEMEALYEQQ